MRMESPTKPHERQCCRCLAHISRGTNAHARPYLHHRQGLEIVCLQFRDGCRGTRVITDSGAVPRSRGLLLCPTHIRRGEFKRIGCFNRLIMVPSIISALHRVTNLQACLLHHNDHLHALDTPHTRLPPHPQRAYRTIPRLFP